LAFINDSRAKQAGPVFVFIGAAAGFFIGLVFKADKVGNVGFVS